MIKIFTMNVWNKSLGKLFAILLAICVFVPTVIAQAQVSFDPTHYVTVWDSRLTSTRVDNNDRSIVINTHGRNYTVEWVLLDDSGNETSTKGKKQNVTNESGNQVCKITVPTPGKYRIRAYNGAGSLYYLYMHYKSYNNPPIPSLYDNQKLVLVENWSNIKWTRINDAFYNASNMDVIAEDIPDVSAVTDFGSVFAGCSELKYANGKIKYWNVAKATKMLWMFAHTAKFNADLSSWQVGKVTNMQGMFYGASVFNADLSSWRVGNVTDMGEMFAEASSFNQNLNNWDVHKVTNMRYMFSRATSFNQPLDKWNVGKVKDMQSMFFMASAFNQELGGWNVSNVEKMQHMFNEAVSFTSDLSRWKVGKVTNMAGMFYKAGVFTSDLSNWDVSNVTDMGSTFHSAVKFNSDLSRWKVGNCTNMRNMLYACSQFQSDLSGWDVSKVMDMYGLFTSCTRFSSDLSRWNVSKVTNMAYMFHACSQFNSDLSGWDVSKVTNMHSMFFQARKFNSNLNNWNVSLVTDMKWMFSGAASFNQELSKWNLSHLTDADQMLDNSGLDCKNYSATLIGWAKNTNTPTRNISLNNPHRNLRYNRIGKVGHDILISQKGWTITGDIYDRLCGGESELNDFVTVWKTDNPSSRTGNTPTSIALNTIGTNYTVEWESVANPTISGVVIVNSSTESDPYVLDLSSSSAGAGDYRVRVYGGFGSLKGLYMDNNTSLFDHQKLLKVEQWGNTEWEKLKHAFYKAENMDVTATDKPNLNTVTDISYMFAYCYKLQYGNGLINNWNVAGITNMQGLFSNAVLFNQNIGNWNTESVTNMSFMFERANAFNKEIDSWDVGKVVDMNSMFYYANSFNRPLNSWNVSKVTNMKSMFYRAEKFNQSLEDWTLKALSSAESMFDYSGVDCFNYSTTLVGWANNNNTSNDVNLGVLGLHYNSTGKAGHDKLKTVNHWTFAGDSYDPYCGGLIKIWTGNVSEDWDNTMNWANNAKPQDGDDVEFATTINHSFSAKHNLKVDNKRVVGRLVNETDKSLVIPEQTSMTVNKMIFGSEDMSNADRIKILSVKDKPNGSLIVLKQPANKPVYATVDMYSKAKKEDNASEWTDNIEGSPTKGTKFKSSYKWQHFGIPVEEAIPNSMFYKSYIREYDETYNGDNTHFYQKWHTIKSYDKLMAFKGYEITQEQPTTYSVQGRLVFGDKQLTLTRKAPKVIGATNPDDKINHWGLGQNIFGNSYTAAINIDKIDFPSEIESTVYIYNTGSFNDWANNKDNTTDKEFLVNGIYLAIPKNVAPAIYGNAIPSMQGFMLKFTDAETKYNYPDVTVTLKYAEDNITTNTNPQKSIAIDKTDSLGYLKFILAGKTSSDIMWLIEAPAATDNFDRGYDGYKFMSRSSSAKIFTELDNKELQVSSSSSIIGKVFAIQPNEDAIYSLTVIKSNLNQYENLHLLDMKTNTFVSLRNDTTVYRFTSNDAGKVEKRFMLVDKNETTGDGLPDNLSMDLLDAYLINNNVLIVNNMTSSEGTAVLQDISGRVISNFRINKGFTEIPVKLSLGVYIASLKAGGKIKTVKIVVK